MPLKDMFEEGPCIVTVSSDRTDVVASFTMAKGDSHAFTDRFGTAYTVSVDSIGAITLDCANSAQGMMNMDAKPTYAIPPGTAMQAAGITIENFLVGVCAYVTGSAATVPLAQSGPGWAPDPAIFDASVVKTGVGIFAGDGS